MPCPDVETQQAASLHYVLPTHRVTAYTTNKKGGCLGNRPFGIIIPLYIYALSRLEPCLDVAADAPAGLYASLFDELLADDVLVELDVAG